MIRHLEDIVSGPRHIVVKHGMCRWRVMQVGSDHKLRTLPGFTPSFRREQTERQCASLNGAFLDGEFAGTLKMTQLAQGVLDVDGANQPPAAYSTAAHTMDSRS